MDNAGKNNVSGNSFLPAKPLDTILLLLSIMGLVAACIAAREFYGGLFGNTWILLMMVLSKELQYVFCKQKARREPNKVSKIIAGTFFVAGFAFLIIYAFVGDDLMSRSEIVYFGICTAIYFILRKIGVIKEKNNDRGYNLRAYSVSNIIVAAFFGVFILCFNPLTTAQANEILVQYDDKFADAVYGHFGTEHKFRYLVDMPIEGEILESQKGRFFLTHASSSDGIILLGGVFLWRECREKEVKVVIII